MSARRKKPTQQSNVKLRDPEARLLACPSLRMRVVAKRPSAKSDRARVKRELKAGRVPESGIDQGSIALSGIADTVDAIGISGLSPTR
ncbi:MAG: hypothetical protein AAFY56_05035 [Pseudomonadota bacterium]